MLKKLRIQNFQSHKNTVVEFSENVTCFTGLNNHGKSAILKALWKIVRDEPDGTVFMTRIPSQESQCNITLETDKGIIERVVKLSGTGNNMYLVNDIPFSNFGKTGIPEEVIDALEISSPIDFGGLSIDLNFQNQLDTLFLMQGAGLPSIRGKVLGKVTNVDEVQRAIQLGASEEKQSKQELNRLQKEIESNKVAQESYKDLPDQEIFLSFIASQFEKIQNIERKKGLIEDKKEELKKIIASAKIFQEVLNRVSKDFKNDIETIQIVLRKLLLLKDFLNIRNSFNFYSNITLIELPVFDFSSFISRISLLTGLYSLSSLQPRLHYLKVCANVPIAEDIPRIEAIYNTMLNYKQFQEVLYTFHMNLMFYQEQERSCLKEQEIINEEFENLKKELKICPTCLRSFE